jgi:hypothetical protein
MKLTDFYMMMFKDEEVVQQKITARKASGIIPGIDFKMDGSIGNTFKSHRLIDYALEVGGTEL